jgi:hypothetical protein
MIGQTVPINVDVVNAGTTPLTNVTFGWSVNGDVKPSVTWTPQTALGSYQGENNIPIGTFQVDDATIDVVVWIETINGQPETITWNDTVSVRGNATPIAEFVAPLVGDTITVLTFEVNATINGVTGAPATMPMLYLEAITDNNAYHVFDSAVVINNAGIWTATVPKQYYLSNVIYSLVVTDTLRNTYTVKDTVYINYPDFGRIDETIIGTGRDGVLSNTSAYYAPLSDAYAYNWSRQLYLFDEVCKTGSLLGTYIKSIAWESNSIAGIYNDQTCYMRVIDDTNITGVYIDPTDTSNHLQKVWAGTITVYAKDWAEIILDVPFYLPYGKNLDIVWHNKNGIGSGNFSPFWYQTYTSNGQNMSTYVRGADAFPTSNATIAYACRTNLKVKTEDGIAFESYLGSNLGLLAIASPVNTSEVTCLPDYSPIRTTMRNLGEKGYNFSVDSVILYAEVIDPYQIKSLFSTVLNTGELVPSEMRDIEIAPSLSLLDAGRYQIKVWLESPIDRIVYDDTLFYVYRSGRAGLPMKDDFGESILSNQFVVQCVVPEGGTEKWEPYTDPTSTILPPEGNDIVRYVGSYGTMTRLKTRQLDLYRVSDPLLTFWYYHDNSASDLDNSYTEVSVVVNGVPNIVRTLFRKGATTGWVKDSIDLTPYIGYQCVYVQFEAMNKYNAQSAQYLGLVSITSTPDLAVSSIEISPNVALCDFENRDLSVVLTTNMNQTIDFSVNKPDLKVEVDSRTFTVPLENIVIPGSASYSVPVQSNIDLTGVKNIKAYLTVPVDRYALNDTANLVIDIQPKLSMTVKSLTAGVDCFVKGSTVQQEITLKNDGNVDLSGIKLSLRITAGEDYEKIIDETGTLDLAAGEDTAYTFKNTYVVPEEATYQVVVTATLGCDELVTVSGVVDECTDMHDVLIVGLVSPDTLTIGNTGSTENITISLENRSDKNRYLNIPIAAVIEDENGNRISNLSGNIEVIEALSPLEYTFPGTYTVPSDLSVYYIRIYISRVDNYPHNDTLLVRRQTNVGIDAIKGKDDFTLGQNIPNPANATTRINYTIPEAGQVMFHVHNITGQLLYSRTIEASRGNQSIELNTAMFSAGVYFYSIEYKGQRIVKRMSVR